MVLGVASALLVATQDELNRLKEKLESSSMTATFETSDFQK